VLSCRDGRSTRECDSRPRHRRARGAAARHHRGARKREGEGLQITVYNQDFALIRQARSLRLREGENEVRVGGVTAMLEPDSVVLRDRLDPKGLRILEQRYAGDPLSQGYLLRESEGESWHSRRSTRRPARRRS